MKTSKPFLLCLIFAITLSITSYETYADSRDDDLFGDDDSTLISVPKEGGEEEIESSLKSAFKDTLLNKEKNLDIGGSFEYSNSLLISEKGQVGDATLGTSGVVDLYFDARFDEGLRFYYQQKVSNSVKGQQDIIPLVLSRLGEVNDIDQLWMKFSFDERYYFTIGKQPTKLGAGLIWQPTDFLNVDRFNPLDLSDQRLGVNLLKIQMPLPDKNLNVYVIAQFDDASTVKETGALIRFEYLSGSGEYAFSAKSSRDSQVRLGLDASIGMKYFDWMVSATFIHNDPAPFIFETPDPVPLNILNPVNESTSLDRSEEWFNQFSTGLLYTHSVFDNKTLIVNAEYFYNEAGYTSREVMPFIIVNSFIPGSETSFNPLYFGKEYGAVGATINGLGSDTDKTITILAISNLDDQTGVVQLVYRSQPFRDLSLSTSVGWFLGNDGVFRPNLGETSVPFTDGLLILPPRFNANIQLGLSF